MPEVKAYPDSTKHWNLNPFTVSTGYFGNEWKVINKFGDNQDIDAAQGWKDIVKWATGTNANWTPLTSAETMDVASSSTNDDSGGTGARTLYIEGLDNSYNEINETITMDGTNTVVTSKEFLRVHRAYAKAVGSGGVNDGNITISATTAGTNQGYINSDDGQTLQTIYTIPLGYTGYFYEGQMTSGDTTKYTEGRILFRIHNGTEYESWRSQGIIDITGLSVSLGLDGSPALPEKTDIRMQANADANNTEVSGRLKILLYRN